MAGRQGGLNTSSHPAAKNGGIQRGWATCVWFFEHFDTLDKICVSFGYLFWHVFTKGVQSQENGLHVRAKNQKGEFGGGGGVPQMSSKIDQNVS